MLKNYSSLVCHYHYCDTLTWLSVRALLDRILIGRIRSGLSSFKIRLDDVEFETIRDFQEQMDTAYLHPRRDSYQVKLIRNRYNWDTHLHHEFRDVNL